MNGKNLTTSLFEIQQKLRATQIGFTMESERKLK